MHRSGSRRWGWLAITAFVLGIQVLWFTLGAPTIADTTVPTTVGASHLSGVDTDSVDWRAKTVDWWKSTLPSQVYDVCRMGGTERPGTGALLDQKKAGVFVCSSCGQPLFSADDKFDSGTGWPSFTDKVKPSAVRDIVDTSHGMIRTEVRCGRCDAHLGHVFPDGPPPTGLRYCINSVCLLHVPDKGLGGADAKP